MTTRKRDSATSTAVSEKQLDALIEVATVDVVSRDGSVISWESREGIPTHSG